MGNLIHRMIPSLIPLAALSRGGGRPVVEGEGGQGGHQAEGQGRQGQSAGGGGERGLGAASQGGEEQGASQEHIR